MSIRGDSSKISRASDLDAIPTRRRRPRSATLGISVAERYPDTMGTGEDLVLGCASLFCWNAAQSFSASLAERAGNVSPFLFGVATPANRHCARPGLPKSAAARNDGFFDPPSRGSYTPSNGITPPRVIARECTDIRATMARAHRFEVTRRITARARAAQGGSAKKHRLREHFLRSIGSVRSSLATKELR